MATHSSTSYFTGSGSSSSMWDGAGGLVLEHDGERDVVFVRLRGHPGRGNLELAVPEPRDEIARDSVVRLARQDALEGLDRPAAVALGGVDLGQGDGRQGRGSARPARRRRPEGADAVGG